MIDTFNLQLPLRHWFFFNALDLDNVIKTRHPTENIAVFLKNISTPDLFFFAITNKDNTKWVQVSIYPNTPISTTNWRAITTGSENTLTYLKNEYFTNERTPTLQMVSK